MPEIRYVRSVEHAVSALELIARADRPLSLAEVVRNLRAPKSTVLNILRTLVKRRLLEHDEQGRTYRIGHLLAALADRAVERADLPQLARAHLEVLARTTGEVALLAVPDGDGIIFITKVESSQSIQYVAQIGTHRSLHNNSAGKVTLAMQPVEEWQKYTERSGLRRYTPKTITEPARLLRELKRIRKQGYAISDGELLPDLIGIAAPVFRGTGGPFIATVVVAGPAFRMRPNLKNMIATITQQTSALTAHLSRMR